MRTFHTGGIGTRHDRRERVPPADGGTVELRDCNEVPTTDDDGNDVLVVLKRNGEVAILDDKGRELEKSKVPYGAYLWAEHGAAIKPGQPREVGPAPHADPRREGRHGAVRRHRDRRDLREEDAGQGKKALLVIEHKGDLHPQINIVDGDGNILDFHYLPAKARIEVQGRREITAG
jgi:DNA-directed RNA polymerase subunit beta'